MRLGFLGCFSFATALDNLSWFRDSGNLNCLREGPVPNPLAFLAGVALVLTVLWETFETIVLPRRVTRHFRVTRLFYRSTWIPYAALAAIRQSQNTSDALPTYSAPPSLLFPIAFL